MTHAPRRHAVTWISVHRKFLVSLVPLIAAIVVAVIEDGSTETVVVAAVALIGALGVYGTANDPDLRPPPVLGPDVQ